MGCICFCLRNADLNKRDVIFIGSPGPSRQIHSPKMNRGGRGYARPRNIGQNIFGIPVGGGLGILLIICCILTFLIAATAAAFAIYNSTVLKEDVRLVGGGSKCDDGNPCTRDLKHAAGGCVHHSENKKHRCENPCFAHDDPDPEDDDDDSGHRCDALGNCVGWKCCGDCKRTRDCPDIEFKYGTVAYADKDCEAKGCVYSAFAPILMETPCHDPFATEICAGFLDREFNKTQCLKITPVCEHPKKGRHGHGGRDEEEEETRAGETTRDGSNDDVSTVAFCLYDFECTEFCPPKILVRGEGAVEEGGETKKTSLERLASASDPMRMELNKRPDAAAGEEVDSKFEAVIESYRSRHKRA